MAHIRAAISRGTGFVWFLLSLQPSQYRVEKQPIWLPPMGARFRRGFNRANDAGGG